MASTKQFKNIITALKKEGFKMELFTTGYRNDSNYLQNCYYACLSNRNVLVKIYDYSPRENGCQVFYNKKKEWNKLSDSKERLIPKNRTELEQLVSEIKTYGRE